MEFGGWGELHCLCCPRPAPGLPPVGSAKPGSQGPLCEAPLLSPLIFFFFWLCFQVPTMLTSGPGPHHPKPIFHFASKHCYGFICLPHVSEALPSPGCGWHPSVYCEWQELGRSAQLNGVHVAGA